MKTRAAVLRGVGQKWEVEELDVDPPKAGEVLVEWKAAGLCHSDEHLVTGDVFPPPELLQSFGRDIGDFFPIVGGHEGAGVVVEVGPGVSGLAPGDHVASSFIPSCGRCQSCVGGSQNLCDNGAQTLGGGMITDGTHRHHQDGVGMPLMAKVGTFSNFTCVSEASIVKVESHFPFECVALVSCGVATGWGSAVRRAGVLPGQTVVVVGVGGVGMNAVQGARMAGARRVIAVDPVAFKREQAESFGATHTFASMEEALPVVQQLTYGRLADKVIMTPGVLHGELLGPAQSLCRKNGTIVTTASAPMMQAQSSVNLFDLTMMNKEIKGSIFGSLNPRNDIPLLLGMYEDGLLKLDELITRRYTLDTLNDGYQDMRDGRNIRGVLVHG